MVIGDVQLWADTFPEELIPRILDLVVDTWATFEKPGPSDYEVPITRRFKHALKQAKNYRRLPVRIEREPAEDDPATGDELGRIDLKFVPAESALEEVYFSFECKRLNVLEQGKRRALAPEYVTEGMMRYVNGKYAVTMKDGGMIGYVLDGNCPHAVQLVEQNIQSRHKELQMTPPGRLSRSSVRGDSEIVRETIHELNAARRFRLHHLFLAGTRTSADISPEVGPLPEGCRP